MNSDYEKLESVIGYEFDNKKLLVNALTHTSYANEHKNRKVKDNERLEFLGDAVLELVSSEFLFLNYEMPEGKMTRLRASLVCEGTLAAMAGATLIEAGMNLQAARGIIYNAWWFDLLLLLLCVNFMLIGRRLNLWSRRRRGALLLHYGFVVILAGAFITHMWGEEGYMHIREGETARRMMTPDRKVQTLPFSVTLNRFTLHRYHGSQSPSHGL